MPSVCCLIRKSDGKHTNEGGITFQQIDEELCKLLGVPVHDKDWVNGWYDHHCFRIALGHDLDRIMEDDRKVIYEYQNKTEDKEYNQRVIEHYQRHLKIGEYLKANYTTDSWREHKRA